MCKAKEMQQPRKIIKAIGFWIENHIKPYKTSKHCCCTVGMSQWGPRRTEWSARASARWVQSPDHCSGWWISLNFWSLFSCWLRVMKCYGWVPFSSNPWPKWCRPSTHCSYHDAWMSRYHWAWISWGPSSQIASLITLMASLGLCSFRVADLAHHLPPPTVYAMAGFPVTQQAVGKLKNDRNIIIAKSSIYYYWTLACFLGQHETWIRNSSTLLLAPRIVVAHRCSSLHRMDQPIE